MPLLGGSSDGALAPLALPSFRRLFAARMLSWSGCAIAPIGLAFAVLRLPGGASVDGLGRVLACGVVPQILLFFVSGVWADRWPRHRLMVTANLISSTAQATAVALLWSGVARLWHLALLAAVCGAATALFLPACSAAVADSVPAELRGAANALLRLGRSTVRVGGPAAGASMVAAIGPAWALAWDAVSFAGSAALFARNGGPGAPGGPQTAFARQLREGWADFRSRRWLVVITLQSALVLSVWMVGYQMLGPVYGERFLGGAGPWGVVMSGFAAGVLGGSVLALWWRPRRTGLLCCASAVLMAMPLAAIAARVHTVGLVLAVGAAGMLASLSMTVWTGLLQEVIPRDRLSRAMSYSFFGETVTVPLGYLAAAPASRVLGLKGTLELGALLIALLGTLPLLLPEVRLLSRRVTTAG
ncbi:MFS transporter [Streptomyces noursei]|uniref:MFS transporter n=1 Tax=Streptomyces noursei TaxID=1971 RepID=UPI0023B80C5B|nr:MFS transporter [Streptomyces noursei]